MLFLVPLVFGIGLIAAGLIPSIIREAKERRIRREALTSAARI